MPILPPIQISIINASTVLPDHKVKPVVDVLQQQVTNNITFTYTQDVAATNPLNIRMEWAINSRWSAIAQRDIYGELDLNFFYKKRFH